jgi:hypothetical protein
MKLLLALLLGVTVVPGPVLAPSGVMATPTRYDRQLVSVLGIVHNIVVRPISGGTIAQFALCDSLCVNVVEFSKPTFQVGQSLTVQGMFHRIYSSGIIQARNVVIVGSPPY